MWQGWVGIHFKITEITCKQWFTLQESQKYIASSFLFSGHKAGEKMFTVARTPSNTWLWTSARQDQADRDNPEFIFNYKYQMPSLLTLFEEQQKLNLNFKTIKIKCKRDVPK